MKISNLAEKKRQVCHLNQNYRCDRYNRETDGIILICRCEADHRMCIATSSALETTRRVDLWGGNTKSSPCPISLPNRPLTAPAVESTSAHYLPLTEGWSRRGWQETSVPEESASICEMPLNKATIHLQGARGWLVCRQRGDIWIKVDAVLKGRAGRFPEVNKRSTFWGPPSSPCLWECVLFLGTRFSYLYTAVDTPAVAAWCCAWCK